MATAQAITDDTLRICSDLLDVWILAAIQYFEIPH